MMSFVTDMLVASRMMNGSTCRLKTVVSLFQCLKKKNSILGLATCKLPGLQTNWGQGCGPCWEGSLVWVRIDNGHYVMTDSLLCTHYLWTWHSFAGVAGVDTLRWVHSPRRKYSSWLVWTQPMMDSSRNSSLWWMNELHELKNTFLVSWSLPLSFSSFIS